MKVCTHHGLTIAVLTRNEHCPPHVHVGTDKWDARFEFSFWHNGVRLWDVTPEQNEPSAPVLESLRLALKAPANLRRARACWWDSRQTLCLDNLLWDMDADEVVSPKDKRPTVRKILSACFDQQAYKTVLQLAGETTPLEIEL
jgi:hypothetical protein